MARPISKYFTPVIKKIIEAKQAENIVVDQTFKASLRQEIVAHIGGLDVRGEGFNVDRFSDGVAGFFRKWKYQMALVPVAFVMVLVAAQSFKMPVGVKSEVVVPTAMESSVPAVSDEKPGEAIAFNTELEVARNMVVPDESPVEFATEVSVPTIIDYSLPAPEPYVPETGGGAVPERNDVVSTQNIPVQQINRQSGNAVPSQTIVTQENNKNIVVADSVINTQQVQKSAKKPGTAAGDVPAELINQTEPTSLTVIPEAGSIAPAVGGGSVLTLGNVQTAIPQDVAPQTAVSAPITEALTAPVPAPPVVSRTVEGVKLVEVAAPPVPEIVLPIYYEQTFVEDLKPEFEEKILVDLVKSEEFTLASVSRGTDEVVKVELFLKDGSSLIKHYLKNTRTGVWNEVRYVQRYFYDDSFEYVRSYRSYPDSVHPYQYPYLNR